MKVLIAYTSLNGGTKRLAEGISRNLKADEILLKDMEQVTENDISSCDVIAAGYWVESAVVCAKGRKFLERVSGKYMLIFATLAYYADSEHAWECLQDGVNRAQKNGNQVLGSFICNGALSDDMLRWYAGNEEKDPGSVTEEMWTRWEVLKEHPTPVDILAASERFNEKLEIYRRLRYFE